MKNTKSYVETLNVEISMAEADVYHGDNEEIANINSNVRCVGYLRGLCKALEIFEELKNEENEIELSKLQLEYVLNLLEHRFETVRDDLCYEENEEDANELRQELFFINDIENILKGAKK